MKCRYLPISFHSSKQTEDKLEINPRYMSLYGQSGIVGQNLISKELGTYVQQ